MALTECPECRGQISTKAPRCPHCGAPRLATPRINRKVIGKRNARFVVIGLFVFFGFVLISTGTDLDRTTNEPAMAKETSAPSIPESTICRAGIATVMGQDFDSISIWPENRIWYARYVREEDQQEWNLRCKVEGARIVWAATNGRWRNGPHDGKVTWQYDSDKKLLSVKEQYGGQTMNALKFELN